MQQKIAMPKASLSPLNLSRRDFLKGLAATAAISTLGLTGVVRSSAQWTTILGLFGGFALDVLGNVASDLLGNWMQEEATRYERERASNANESMAALEFIYDENASVYVYNPRRTNRVSFYALQSIDNFNACAAFIALEKPSHASRDFVLNPLVEGPVLLAMAYAAQTWDNSVGAAEALIPLAVYENSYISSLEESFSQPMYYATEYGYTAYDYTSYPNSNDGGRTGVGVVQVQATDADANVYFEQEKRFDWTTIA